ncbi:glycosyltransferase [Vagococcus lutrae]|uniref:glycosyltransferase n=1 Tax=Vagococcus lutrae TaxID=81947 RepID=UPI00232DED66|nr:glycosyltransferase [Vagococcus lutrae]WCG04781.1 glycosyltransferase [Vagococcus lutrae]
MKVLIVNSVCGVGSTGRICTDLYEHLEKEGHECCIAFGRGVSDSKYKTYKIGGKLNNIVHGLETRLFDNHGFSSRRATSDFISFIEKYKPEVIHLHNLHGYYLNIKIFFSYLKEKEIKTIWTFHDAWSFSGHSATIDFDNKGKLETIVKNKAQMKMYPKTWFLNRSKINIEKKESIFSNHPNLKIIVPSYWMKNMVKASFFNQYEINVIHNGIDLNKFYPNRTELSQKTEILGVSNIWSNEKGIEFFQCLDKKLDADKYKITLVGKTPPYVSRQNSINFIERTNNLGELRKIYSNSDIFINPTLFDNYPTVNMEAIACGVPVITFETGGSPESISQETGIVLKEKTCNQIINAIQIIEQGDYNLNKCLKHSKKFSKKLMLDRYAEEYFNF